MSDHVNGVLASFSDALATSVETAGSSVVTVSARQRLAATGIIWSADGWIVTANHVVERDDEITVTLPDGTTVEATLTGRDPGSDIALLTVAGKPLVPAPRSSATPKPGHIVLAVGRPGKGGLMASLGVISLVGGPWRNNEGVSIDSFFRSDAAMLPGFSGGPLVDSSGGILGMNSSTLGRKGGLTIPVATIDRVVELLQSHGKVRRGFLGIGAQSVEINPGLRTALGIDQERALVVVNVQPDGPAEVSGLLIGDVILSIKDQSVATVEQLQDHLTGEIVGTPVTIRLIRGGVLIDQQVIAGERGS